MYPYICIVIKTARMEQQITRLENQIKILEKKFSETPEFIQVKDVRKTKHNPKYFALKNKIKNLYKKLNDAKRMKYLAM